VGWALLAGGVVAAVLAFLMLRRRVGPMPAVVAFAAACLTLTVAAVPYVLWRFADDLRVTTKLHGYDAASAGPIQAFLPGYLVDGAQRYIPRDATFATAVGPGIPWAPARAAFPSLALTTLFPRHSVADPTRADYIVSWGVSPGRIAPVSRVWVARPRAGAYAAVYVGKVRH
jgi:hypothetical protein